MTAHDARARYGIVQQSMVVSTMADQRDPIGGIAQFMNRASAQLDVRQPIFMSCFVYFKHFTNAQQAGDVAAQAGWRATLYAVPQAFVLRLVRRRLLADGLLDTEREQVEQISATYAGDWRYVLLEEGTAGSSFWELMADEVRQQVAACAPAAIPAQRQPSALERRQAHSQSRVGQEAS